MKKNDSSTIKQSVVAIKKSSGTLNRVIDLITTDRNYSAVIQQIDAAIGLAQSAKKSLMSENLARTIRESKNSKRLLQDLQKLYLSAVK
jgi:DNA-binding FrmR family transcriptional regulator